MPWSASQVRWIRTVIWSEEVKQESDLVAFFYWKPVDVDAPDPVPVYVDAEVKKVVFEVEKHRDAILGHRWRKRRFDQA